ncbi:VWCE protein, partial [Nyctiprogne leucopyga]|nr:VWCE protein [Nyctiprogne leucopyga]
RGVPREPGARWMEPGCRSCACQGGRVLCEAISCPVGCSHPLPTPAGSCCPTCAGCLHEGVVRAEGDVFSPSNGNCTVCVCLVSPHSPLPLPSPAKCSFRGRTYAHGSQFSLDGDGCTICVCRGGEVECSFAPCPVLDCPQHQQHLGPGQCCFTCRDPPAPAGCFVDDNGVEFPIGQIWSPGDPCELCICQADGSVSCKRTDCVETCPYPIHTPGQCCPDCSADCNYQGRKVVNGQTFTPEGQPCTRCTCQVSGV